MTRKYVNRMKHLSLTVWGAVLAAIAICPAGFAGTKKYEIGNPGSWLLAITGKMGVFSFAAHKHAVFATRWSAEVRVDAVDPRKSTATVTIPVSALIIDSAEARQRAELGAGPSAKDVREIQLRMLGPEVLDAKHYPEIRLTTTAVEKTGSGALRITGRFTMHGHSKMISVPANYEENGKGGGRVHGQFTIQQTDFGIRPQSVAGGTVKVADEVTIRFQVVITPKA